jgi:hypothetical protein
MSPTERVGTFRYTSGGAEVVDEALVMLAETLEGVEVTDEEVVLVEIEACVVLLEDELWLVEVDVAVAALMGVANAHTQATSARSAWRVNMIYCTVRTTERCKGWTAQMCLGRGADPFDSFALDFALNMSLENIPLSQFPCARMMA